MKKNVLFFFIMILSSSCYHDKYEELHPLENYVNDCDTTLLDSYTSSVSLVINSNCASCHSSSNKSGNVDLSNYSSVVNAANSGQLMGSIQHSSGYNVMPPYSNLQQCEIDRLQRWIQKGLPQ
jgi:hypothetical protein